MIKKILSAISIGCAFVACDNSTAPPEYKPTPKSNTSTVVPVDYTAGRIMNARLGRGINLGNSWESTGRDDAGWGNPIRDTDFAVIKAAGFNSVRIPVQWHQDADKTTHMVAQTRLQGVMEDIQLAINNGLAVVVNFHHYSDLNCAGGGGNKWDPVKKTQVKCTYNAAEFEAEKAHFLGMWTNLATALNVFPDSMLVLEILNEPSIPRAEIVDQLMNDAYKVIRAAAPGKTIMFESYHLAKFYELPTLHLPPDGNIIFSGHYYEPYQYSHQGLGYSCKGDLMKSNMASRDMNEYANIAKEYYPDINGVDHIPLNMGEFGVAGGSGCNCPADSSVSEAGKAEWAQKTVQAAWKHGISFHYWSFGPTSGFEAFNIYKDIWYPGFPEALLQ
jgi:Endoglucanase